MSKVYHGDQLGSAQCQWTDQSYWTDQANLARDNMTKQRGGVYLGSKPQTEPSEITRLARSDPSFVARFPFVIVTCIDGDRELHLSMPSIQRLLDLHLPIRAIGNHLLTTGETVAEMAFDLAFFWGFDELWMFSMEPAEDVPGDLWVRSAEFLKPEHQATRVAAEQWGTDVTNWMLRSGAVLGLADGISLDYVTTNEQVANEIDRLYSV